MMKKTKEINVKQLVFFLIIVIIFILSLVFDKQIFSFLNHIKEKISGLKLQTIENEYVFYPILLILGTVLILIDKKKGRKSKKILLFLFSFFVTVAIALLIKIVVARPRPDQSFSSVIDNSFPSGHSVASFVLVPFLENKTLRILWLVFACFIALSRIWLGPHYLSDVIAGSLIGYIVPAIIIKIFKK
jgi:undecaprenyl-diphosphatase